MDDPSGRQIHEQALAEVLAEIKQLQGVADYHRRKLGVGDAENGGQASVAPQTSIGGDPVASVAAGEFYAMSAPKATRALLERMGRTRPLKTEEIFNAIKKGGVDIGSTGSLYRSLFRESGIFHNVGRGVWGLTVWYPNVQRRARRGAATDAAAADPSTGNTLDESGDSAPGEEGEEV